MTEHDHIAETRPRTWDRLDGMVVLLTCAFWTINALQLSARSLIIPSSYAQVDGVWLARLASLGTGILLTLGMWLILRRSAETRAFVWFGRAALLGLAVCLVHTLLNAVYFRFLTDYHALTGERFPDPRGLASTYISFLWPIMTWSALCAVMVAGDNLRQQQRRTSEAQAAAQQAQLAALRLQIQPHFLFNTLNSVSSLIGQGRAQEADTTVLRLAQFLRHTLAAAPRELVRFESELDGQSRYLDIEQIRFPDRLRRRLAVEPETLSAMVPSLVLQPFVENAVKHGLARSVNPVTIEIGARREGSRLKLWIIDDAVGSDGAGETGLGLSLVNAARRVELLYGPDAVLRHGPQAQGGWRVELELPYEVAA